MPFRIATGNAFGRIRTKKKHSCSTHSADQTPIRTADIPSARGISMLSLAASLTTRGKAAQVPRELKVREPTIRPTLTDPTLPYPTHPKGRKVVKTTVPVSKII